MRLFLPAAELLEKIRVIKPSHLLDGASRYVFQSQTSHSFHLFSYC